MQRVFMFSRNDISSRAHAVLSPGLPISFSRLTSSRTTPSPASKILLHPPVYINSTYISALIYVIFVLQSAPFTVNVSPSILVRLFSQPGASFSCSYRERLAIMFSRIDQCRYNSSSSYSFACSYENPRPLK